MPERPISLVVVLLLTALVAAPGHAALEPPVGKVILQVGGDIEHTNRGATAEFDRSMLERLGTRVVRTHTPWTRGVIEFEGVLVRDLLRAVGATSANFEAASSNGYAVTVEDFDFAAYPAVLAMRMNGDILADRDKGPIWVVFPWDQHPELDRQTTANYSIWQLARITVIE